MMNGPKGSPPGPPRERLPAWLANTVGQVVKVWMANGVLPLEGYLASVEGGFIELVEREPDPARDSFGKWVFVASYLQIGHICRIAPLDAQSQWQPIRANAGLALPEKPKLVI